MEDAKFKICIFGDSGVGKTTLVNRYLTGLFSDPAKTLGADFHIKYLNINKKKVFLQIWDFAGEERFRFILPSYILGASGCIFMYDITDRDSFLHFEAWYKVFMDGTNQNKENIPLLISGGKLDLNDKRTISYEEGSILAKNNNLCDLIECSSKTGVNIEDIFIKITKAMMKKIDLL